MPSTRAVQRLDGSSSSSDAKEQQQPASELKRTRRTSYAAPSPAAAASVSASIPAHGTRSPIATSPPAAAPTSLGPLASEQANLATQQQQQGAVQVPISVVDALPEPVFPKDGHVLHPLDRADELLVLCAKAIASCDNRALTPKEIALICERKWNWTFQGSQPFGLVSAAIRSHLRRAALSAYPPIFCTYELSSVPPAEDIPCLGIEPDARPVVKRGTFWFLAETTGYPSPFPHRPSETMQAQALGTSKQKASSITLSFLSQSKPKNDEKPMTRAQANAASSKASSSSSPLPISEQQPPPPPQVLPALNATQVDDNPADPLGRGKRKRTASAALAPFASPLSKSAPLLGPLSSSTPKPAAPAALPAAPAATIPVPTTVPVTDRRTRNGLPRRRASSGSTDLQQPIGLRKLKLRLPPLSESDPALEGLTATQKQLAQSTPVSAAGTPQQPNPKRQRTQSMSVLQHPGLSQFPLNDLHLWSRDPVPSSLPANPSGTLFPLEMHFPSSPAQFGLALDLLTSRSAPESNLFSPPMPTDFVHGPFSRRASPKPSNLRQTRATRSEDGSVEDTTQLDVYDGWASDHGSLTKSTILAAQQELADPGDFHEAMLKSELDLLDYSMESSNASRALSEDHESGEDVDMDMERETSVISIADEVDGIFEGLSGSASNTADHDTITEQDLATIEEQKLALQEALSTTLCPAAGGALKPGRLLARRLNSASSLHFPRLSGQTFADALRPGRLSRTNSRDALPTPVPLAEIPGLVVPVPHNPILLYSDDRTYDDDREGSVSRATSSTPLTPIVKSEEDADDFMELQAPRQLSRASSSVSEESVDSFSPAMIYASRPITDERSQSSSRISSISPRESYSPQAVGPGADWALTPPSEEEHMDDEEKTLDRATLLGPESVGMDDLDDVWPEVRTEAIEKGMASVHVYDVEDRFEPVLSPAPIPENSLASGLTFADSPPALKLEDRAMDVDLDENSAAAMFIAEEQLPPKSPAVQARPPIGARQSTPTQPSAKASRSQTSPTPTEPVSTRSVSEAPAAEPTAKVPQSYLFYPDKPFDPPITILLTDTKILFYSTLVTVQGVQRPLLRRVDNDAVDGEALLLSLEGNPEQDQEREDTFVSIKELGNTWVSIDYARELLARFGAPGSHLKTFLADDIILNWNDKLLRLGTMLRQKNGLSTVSRSGKKSKPIAPTPSNSSKAAAKHASATPLAPATERKKVATKELEPQGTKSDEVPTKATKAASATTSNTSPSRRSTRHKATSSS